MHVSQHRIHKASPHAPGEEADAEFDYMQRAQATRMDEAAAPSCMKKLLADFEPCVFLPLLFKSATDPSNAKVQVCTKSRSVLYDVERCSTLTASWHGVFLASAM